MLAMKLLPLLSTVALLLSPVSTLAQAKPPTTLFSQMKKLRGVIPQKSGFETIRQYRDKINSIKPSTSPVILEIPHDAKYDVESQQLKIEVKTTYDNFEALSSSDKLLIADGSSYSNFRNVLFYREDKGLSVQENVTCVNGLGRKFYYKHVISQSTRYLISLPKTNEISVISLQMEPEQAKKYFSNNETYLNRLKVKITAYPIAPFYSSFSSDSGDSCPKTPLLRTLSDFNGETNTYLFKNHLIYLSLDKYEIFDSVSGQKLFPPL
jgi:hypothetical protein